MGVLRAAVLKPLQSDSKIFPSYFPFHFSLNHKSLIVGELIAWARSPQRHSGALLSFQRGKVICSSCPRAWSMRCSMQEGLRLQLSI